MRFFSCFTLPSLLLTLFAVSLTAQTPAITSVANYVSFQDSLAPGLDVIVSGSNLAPTATLVSVTLGGKPCGIFFIGEGGLGVQLPMDAPAGPSEMVVSHDGLTSSPYPVTLSSYAPTFFTTFGGNGYFWSGPNTITPYSPAINYAGVQISGLAVGLGATSPLAPIGQPTPTVPSFPTAVQPVVKVGGQVAALGFAGLQPNSVGYYEIDFTLPPGLYGTQEVTLEIGGVTSAPVLITIQTPASININTGSTSQSTDVGTGFATPLSVTVKDANGNTLPGSVVTFTAPVSGASATFANGVNTAVTDDVGVATVTAFANGTAGSYNIIASAAGLVQTVTFALTNTPPSSTPNTLTVSASPVGVGVTAPLSGSAYANGSVVPLTAVPSLNSTFTGWSGPVAYPQSPLTTVTMNGSESVTANFTGQIFSDVPATDYFFDAVNLMSLEHITSGCGVSIYCSLLQVTRAQMAVFIVRTVMRTDNFTYTQTPYFTDVPPGSFGYQWIQKLRDLGITTGCGPTSFCPSDPVTRAQMAVFVIRARYGANATFSSLYAPYFSDVPRGTFAFDYIQRMKRDHITNGCGIVSYCPNNPVTRGDMAIFVVRGGLNFLLPPTDPVIAQISPTSVSPGQRITLSVSAVNTHFDQQATLVQAIPGFFFTGPVTVTSPTTLTVGLTADTNVTLQPQSVWITTRSEEAVLPNALSIQ